MNWYARSAKDVTTALETNQERGLTQEEAENRLQKFGPNRLAEKKKTSVIIRFLMQFNDFMIIILLAAAFISFMVNFLSKDNDYFDPIIILAIVTVNALLALFQENKAEKALEALKKMSAPQAKVIRAGQTVLVDTDKLVPGDLIVLETGDFVPADARLTQSVNLKTEEAALTGESVPVEKDAELVLADHLLVGDRHNMVFSGSSVSYGRGQAIVTDTGMHTEVGRIADLMMSDETPETPLQKRLAETGKHLGIGVLIICVVIFGMGLLRSIPVFEMFMTSVSLAVAAIPEGLPVIVTIMLAIGVQRMAKKNAVVRKLPAVETLGGANVICSDKTGTLTQNRMTVVEIADAGGSARDGVAKTILEMASLCNDTIVNYGEDGPEYLGDPTEIALTEAAETRGFKKSRLEADSPRIGEAPFDAKRKRMSTVHAQQNGKKLVITKGAPDMLLERCGFCYINGEVQAMTESRKRGILLQNDKMADKALRVIGVACREIPELARKATEDDLEKDLIFIGLVGMIDPPRAEVPQAVETCKRAGIRPVMVTGDHVSTAIAIARKIGIYGLGDKAMTGAELNEISQEELAANIYEYSVFARVSPEHKVRIVKAFQSRDAVVAMTGDGVNDAPALKAADIGCAMGISGTDVAKGAAAMVLTDDNFATIVEAVREGRGIYANIRKAVHFLLSSNIGEIMTIFVAIMLGWSTPLYAIHLLWVNLVTDSLPAIALGLDQAEKDIMRHKPKDSHKSLFSGGLWQRIIFEGLMIGMLALIAFGIGSIYFDIGGSHIKGGTMAFATLSISQLFHAFNMRSEKSILNMDIFSNLYLVGALAAGIVLQASVIMIPPLCKVFRVVSLSFTQWLIVLLLSLMPIVIVELQKRFGGDAQAEDIVRVKGEMAPVAAPEGF